MVNMAGPMKPCSTSSRAYLLVSVNLKMGETTASNNHPSVFQIFRCSESLCPFPPQKRFDPCRKHKLRIFPVLKFKNCFHNQMFFSSLDCDQKRDLCGNHCGTLSGKRINDRSVLGFKLQLNKHWMQLVLWSVKTQHQFVGSAFL